VLLQVFVVLLGLGAVACVIFCCIRKLWLEAAIAGVFALLCIHVSILQAERKKLETQMQQAALTREEPARRGLELVEESAAGHVERLPAKGCLPVPSADEVFPAHVHSPSDKVVADPEPQKDLDKVMLNALAKEYLRCNMALQDYRKRYGPLDSKDSNCSAKRIDGRRLLGERFTVDPAFDASIQHVGVRKNLEGDFSGAVPAASHHSASQAVPVASHNSALQDDKLVVKRPPAALTGHVPDIEDQQAKSGWVGEADGWGGTGRVDNGAGVIRLLPQSPRGGPPPHLGQEKHATAPQLTLPVRRRQPGQSRQGPPTVSLAARDQSRFTDCRTGLGLAL